MKKAIIFDLDGTLLNTIKDINVSINKTLKILPSEIPKRFISLSPKRKILITISVVANSSGERPAVVFEKSLKLRHTKRL